MNTEALSLLAVDTRFMWLSPFLVGPNHPFTRNICAPFFWTFAMYVVSTLPLIGSGRWLELALSRPFAVCFTGILCTLLLAYGFLLLYRHMLRDISLALLPCEMPEAIKIIQFTVSRLNDDRSLLLVFFPILALIAITLATLSFFQILDRDGYGFLYFLDESWYIPGTGRFFSLLSIWLIIFFTTLMLCTGFWFQFYHW